MQTYGNCAMGTQRKLPRKFPSAIFRGRNDTLSLKHTLIGGSPSAEAFTTASTGASLLITSRSDRASGVTDSCLNLSIWDPPVNRQTRTVRAMQSRGLSMLRVSWMGCHNRLTVCSRDEGIDVSWRRGKWKLQAEYV